MADFTQAIEKLLKLEGGFSTHDTTAGAVNFGITQRFLEQLGRPHSIEDVKNLTHEEAVQIYKQEFWDKLHIGKINNQHIAEAYFFSAVNMGPYFPSLFLQESLKEIGVPIALDGIIGPYARAKLNALNDDETNLVIMKFSNKLRSRYETLARVSPEYAAALPGWLARLS